MPNVISESTLQSYLAELARDEAQIQEAGDAFQAARARLDVSLRRYVALRDFIAEQLGQSPYAPGTPWPGPTEVDEAASPTERGTYRFTEMKIGDAILEVLRESATPMTLETILSILAAGGLGFPDPVESRAVNAALMRTRGIKRTKDDAGQTLYQATDPDDDPHGSANDAFSRRATSS